MNTQSLTARGDPGPEVIGAVMVIGGGIAGMQAALDIAEAGHRDLRLFVVGDVYKAKPHAAQKRLARDLHDAVNQNLFSASLIAETMPALWRESPQEAEQLLDRYGN